MVELTATQLSLLKKLGKAAGQYLAAQIRKDSENRYSLRKDWLLPKVPYAIGDFENEAFSIVTDYESDESLILVKAFRSTKENKLCDGATHAPDNFLGVNFIPSAVFHDRFYASIAEIAEKTGTQPEKLREYADKIFTMIAYAENGHGPFTKFIVSSYYYGIRIFGSSHVKKLIQRTCMIAAVTLMLGGAGGCANFFFPDENDYTEPDVEQIADSIETETAQC